MADDPADLAGLTARVHALEKHVDELHDVVHAAREPEESQQPGAVADAGKFWALQGLKARTDPPGAVLFTGSIRLSDDEPVEWQQGASAESLLEADWGLAADALAALGQPVRLTLLREVLRGTHTVAALGSVEGVGTSGQLYHHLRQLITSGWLRTAGRGRYEVPATRVVPLLVVMAAAQR